MAYTTDLTPILLSNTSNGIASASSEYNSSYYAYKAFDSNTETYWSTTTDGATPCWLAYQWLNYTYAYAITQYTITCYTSTTAPKDFIFQGSNDGSTWTDLDTQTSISWLDAEQKTFSFSNSNIYMNYRLYITDNNGGSTTAIADFELMATIATNPQVAGVALQTEITSQQPCIAGLSLQTEIGIPDIQIAGISMQVEFEILENRWKQNATRFYNNSVWKRVSI